MTDSRKPGALSGRLERGAGLLFVGMVGVRLVGIVSIAILARLLTPVDFGILALALLMTGLMQAISERQVELVLIRMKDPGPDDFNTAFGLTAAWGVIAAGLVMLSAPMLSWLFSNDKVGWALFALSVVPLIDGLRNPYFVQYEKDLSFGRMAFVSFGERCTTAIVATAMALVFGNYWALVLGQIGLSVFRTSMTYVFAARRPSVTFARWRSFASIMGWLMASNVVDYVNRRSATAFLGFGFDTRFVGQFRMGEDLSMMATQQLAMPFRRVLMSGFSKLGEDRQRLRQAFYKAQGTILSLMLPIGVCLALVAGEALLLALGPQWEEAAMVVQFLAPALAFSASTAGTGAILLSHGDMKQVFWRGVAMFVITTPLLVAGLWWQGAIGLVAARALASVVRTTITLHLITSLLNVSILSPLIASWRTFVAAACMAGVVIMADRYLPDAVSLAALGLVLCVKVGLAAAVYASVHVGLWLVAGRPDGAETAILDAVRRRLLRSKV